MFVTFTAKLYRETEEEDTEQRDRRHAMWRDAQRLYDRMNNPLPPRYRGKLENRGYGNGFSRAEHGE